MPVITAPDLFQMSHAQFDDLFRRAVPGPIPDGEGDGTVIFAPEEPIAETTAKLAHLNRLEGRGLRRGLALAA